MKKLILIAAITLGTLVAFGPLVQAADTPPEGTAQKTKARGDRLAQMTKELKLDEKQVEKLKPMLDADAKAMREVMQDSTLSREDRRAKLTTMREDSIKKIKASKILTADQAATWDKLNAERAQKQKKQQ